MSIEKFFKTTFTVKRQVWSGDSSAEETQGTFNGLIEQGVSKSHDEDTGFRFEKPYTIMCPVDTDIQEGDVIEEIEYSGDSQIGLKTYDVKYVMKENLAVNKHLEVIVERND